MKRTSLLTQHLVDVGETYTEHLVHAAAFAARMLVAGVACLIHAVFPFWFVDTGSETIRELHEAMSARRRRTVESADVISASKAVRP